MELKTPKTKPTTMTFAPLQTTVQVSPVPGGPTSPTQTRKWSSKPLHIDERPKIADLFQKTDLHGFPDLYDSYEHKQLIKVVLWFIICILAVVITIYMIVTSVAEFRDNPIITGYEIANDKRGVPFPTVVVCPQNAIHQQNLQDANCNATWMEENFDNIFGVEGLNELTGVLAVKISLQAALAGGNLPMVIRPSPPPGPPWTPKDSVAFLMRVGYTTDQLFKECAFRANAVNCSEIVTPVFDPSHGKCFEVRLDENAAFQTDERSGLSLVLNMDMKNAVKPMGFSEFQQLPSIFNGVEIKLTLDNQTVESAIAASNIPITSYSHMSLEATQLNMITIRDQKCYEEDESDGLLKFHKGPYSQALCKFDCSLQALHDDCGCIFPIDVNYLTADYTRDVFCKASARVKGGCIQRSINGNVYKQKITKCFANCHKPCTNWQLRVTSTTSPLPTIPYLVPKPDAPDGPDFPNMIVLDIAYSTIEYIIMNQEPSVTFASCIGSIGGHVGLFLGASIISCFKFFIIVAPLAYTACRKQK